jgi:hypothetical protein
MSPHQSTIEIQLAAFRSWAEGTKWNSGVLVQYTGPEYIGGLELRLENTESQIEGCLREGFRVEWRLFDGILFVCVIESWEENLDWTKIQRRENFVDINQLLKDAGFDGLG